jgi:hypothetical protein
MLMSDLVLTLPSILHPEDGGNMFLWNIGACLSHHSVVMQNITIAIKELLLTC